MAIISNGTTSITIPNVNEIPSPSIDKVNKTASGGATKQQVAGERLVIKCDARVTGDVFRSVLNLLKDGSQEYFYTTSINHPIYSGIVQPIPVRVNNIGQTFDNRKVYYISFEVESIDYI